MARPTKSVSTMRKNLTSIEKNSRLENEEILKGDSDNILPPRYLNTEQKKIFKYIVKELKAANILGNLDIYILAQASIAINRLQYIETLINEDLSLLQNANLMSSKDKYTRDLYRCCNELSLSPQSRAKMANINQQSEKDKKDPLLALLQGGVRDNKGT